MSLLTWLLFSSAFFAKDTSIHSATGNGVYKDKEATAFFKRTQGAVAMDGGYSIPLSDGRVLWLFGDTYIDNYDSATKTVPCLFQVRNSALLQPANRNWQWPQTKTLLSSEGIKSFIKNKPDGEYFIWPAAGFQLKDTVYIYCLQMKNVKDGLGFGFGGPPVWAKLKFPEMEIAGFSEINQQLDSTEYGQGFIVDSSANCIYAYGAKGVKPLGGNVRVAKISMNDVNGKWQFWNGSSWSNDAASAKGIGALPAYSQHVSKVGNKYLLLTADFSLGCDMGKTISASVSDQPTGPFSKSEIIYTIDDTLQGHYPFFYLPIAHPEFINDKNEVLVNYSINGYGKCIEACVNGRFNPEYYRPQAIRLPLSLLDELSKN